MKKLDDILKGFQLYHLHSDGTKGYDVKPNHSVMFDYFHVNAIMVYPDGTIDARCIGAYLLEGIQNELDEFHVYELNEIA